jgi:hypothetical protein
MWNSGFRILWIKVHTTHFYISFPVCLYVFQELFDCVLDIMEFTCLFIPKNPPARLPHAISVRAIKELIHSTDKLFRSLTDCEPYDLVEVNTKNVTVSIKIR